MSDSDSDRQRFAPGTVVFTGGLALGAGFFAASSGELTLVFLLAAIGVGARYIVGRR